MDKKTYAEGTWFLTGITFLGGYLDAYTYLTRGGVFANNHTANMANLGIRAAQGDWRGAMACLIPMLACVLGAAAIGALKNRPKRRLLSGDWRQDALLLELLALIAAGFIRPGASDFAVNAGFSFLTGYQLCLFRSWEGSAHNTTICTGNLRSLGQYLYEAAEGRGPGAWAKPLRYAFLVFSFAAGAGTGAWICSAAGQRATWAACPLLALWICRVALSEQEKQMTLSAIRRLRLEENRKERNEAYG